MSALSTSAPRTTSAELLLTATPTDPVATERPSADLGDRPSFDERFRSAMERAGRGTGGGPDGRPVRDRSTSPGDHEHTASTRPIAESDTGDDGEDRAIDGTDPAGPDRSTRAVSFDDVVIELMVSGWSVMRRDQVVDPIPGIVANADTAGATGAIEVAAAPPVAPRVQAPSAAGVPTQLAVPATPLPAPVPPGAVAGDVHGDGAELETAAVMASTAGPAVPAAGPARHPMDADAIAMTVDSAPQSWPDVAPRGGTPSPDAGVARGDAGFHPEVAAAADRTTMPGLPEQVSPAPVDPAQLAPVVRLGIDDGRTIEPLIAMPARPASTDVPHGEGSATSGSEPRITTTGTDRGAAPVAGATPAVVGSAVGAASAAPTGAIAAPPAPGGERESNASAADLPVVIGDPEPTRAYDMRTHDLGKSAEEQGLTDARATDTAATVAVGVPASPSPSTSPARADQAGTGTGAAPTGETVDQQLVRVIAPLRQRDGVHEVSLALRPAELGTVTADIRVEHGVVHVSITSEHPGTADLLRRGAHDLRAALADAGLNVASLDVSGDRMRAATASGPTATAGSTTTTGQQGSDSGSQPFDTSTSGGSAGSGGSSGSGGRFDDRPPGAPTRAPSSGRGGESPDLRMASDRAGRLAGFLAANRPHATERLDLIV